MANDLLSLTQFHNTVQTLVSTNKLTPDRATVLFELYRAGIERQNAQGNTTLGVASAAKNLPLLASLSETQTAALKDTVSTLAKTSDAVVYDMLTQLSSLSSEVPAVNEVLPTTQVSSFGSIPEIKEMQAALPNISESLPKIVASLPTTPTQTYTFPDETVDAYLTTKVLNASDQIVKAGGEIYKIVNKSGSFVEISPPIRKTPNNKPFFLEMLDANFKTCSIKMLDGTIIQALKLTPNPDTMTIASGKIINKYNTMTRWVEEHWGDEMDTVSVSGSSFSFMAFVPANGLTVANRRDTKAYQMLKELIKFYRTNGCIYQDSSTYVPVDDIASGAGQTTPESVADNFLSKHTYFYDHHPREGMIRERLYARISFDYVSFIGHFDSFDLIEDSGSPYRFTYSFSFKAEKTVYVLG
jgi:hypothetical protein